MIGRPDGSFVTVSGGVPRRRPRSGARCHLLPKLVGRRMKEAGGDK